MLNNFSISFGVFARSSAGEGATSTYRHRRDRPEVFTKELLAELAEFNEKFAELNMRDGEKLFCYLKKLATLFRNEDWYQSLAHMSLCLDDLNFHETLGEIGTDYLNQAFNEIHRMMPKQSPSEHMSFVLYKLGQPSLPRTQLGFRHIQPFN